MSWKGMDGGGREGGREGGRKPEKTTSAPHLNDFATLNDRITSESHPSERVGSSDSLH